MGKETVERLREDKGMSEEEYLEFEKFVVYSTGIDPWLLNYPTLEKGHEEFRKRFHG